MSLQPALPTEATLDAEGRVAVDAPCVNCGYNLRTLKADALCPECAQPVSFSIHGYFLRFAPPRWVRGLARGLVLVLVALGGAVVVLPMISLIVAIPMMISASKTPGLPPAWPGHFATVAPFIGHGVVLALAIIGLFYLTQPDPAEVRAEGVTARRIIRLCCILLPIPTVVNLIAALYVPETAGWPLGSTTMPVGLGPTFPTFVGLGLASGVLAVVLYSITPVALLRHVISLLRRLPRPGLVRFARVEFWGVLISAALFLVGYGLMARTVFPTLGPLMAATASMPSTTMPSAAPGGAVSTTSYSVAVSSWPGGSVSVAQRPLVTATATAPTGVPGTPGPLSALGSVAPTTSPATSLPTSMPGMPPLPPPGFFTTMIYAGGAGVLGGCGGLVFGVAGVVLMIMAASALFKAAREAESNAAQEAGGARRDSRTSVL